MRPLVAAVAVAVELTLAATATAGVASGPGYLTVSPRAGRSLTLYDAPNGRPLARISHAYFGSRLVATVVRRRSRWAAVETQALPNGVLGWVDLDSGVVTSRVHDALRVSLSARRLSLYRDGRIVRSFTVAVGAATSPTPRGQFAVAEKLPGARFGSAFGCCILALTAHQPKPPAAWRRGETYFVGIHGGGGIGAAVSAGCLHLTDGELRYLMRVVPLGTPVFITA